MYFEPATTATQPPSIGSGVEHLSLDFKATVDIKDFEELGKDIAAFANAVGGVLWVGVDEDKKNNTVRGYNPLKTLAEAEGVRGAYQKAAGDHCSPSPLIDTLAIQNTGPGSGYFVAVSVWPFPGQAVGVRDKGDQYKYRFPIRLGNETTFLRAEQLPMLMVPEFRRVAILLRQIKADDDAEFISESQRWNTKLVEVRELDNVVVLNVVGPPPYPMTIPIDQIESVWRDQVRWRIKARLKWHVTPGGGTSVQI